MRTLSHGDVYIPVRGEGIVPKMEILLKEIDFGPVTLGNSSSLYLPILNTGSDTLRLDLMLLSGSIFKLGQSGLESVPILPQTASKFPLSQPGRIILRIR